MSYIFSSNGNNYTFKKLDNMLINLPEKDGKHVLIRSSKDGDTKYSWETVNLIVNVNDIKATAYNPYQLTKVKGQTIYFDVSKGMNIVTIHAVLYNMNDNAFKDCNSIEDIINKNYSFTITINNEEVLNARILDSLNNLYVFDSTVSFYNNSNDETVPIQFNSNMDSLFFLGGVDGVTLLFQNVEPVTENA